MLILKLSLVLVRRASNSKILKRFAELELEKLFFGTQTLTGINN